MAEYLVVGVWDDESRSRFAQSFDADNPEAAEAAAHQWSKDASWDGSDLIIAAVIVADEHCIDIVA